MLCLSLISEAILDAAFLDCFSTFCWTVAIANVSVLFFHSLRTFIKTCWLDDGDLFLSSQIWLFIYMGSSAQCIISSNFSYTSRVISLCLPLFSAMPNPSGLNAKVKRHAILCPSPARPDKYKTWTYINTLFQYFSRPAITEFGSEMRYQLLQLKYAVRLWDQEVKGVRWTCSSKTSHHQATSRKSRSIQQIFIFIVVSRFYISREHIARYMQISCLFYCRLRELLISQQHTSKNRQLQSAKLFQQR